MALPEELLETHVLSDPTICSRCFNKVMDSQQRSGTTDSSAACSESCGQLGISMESEKIPDKELKSRATRLLSILQENDVEIEEEPFNKAVEHYSGLHPPRKSLEKALAFGMGQRDISELLERQNNRSDNRFEPDSSEGEDGTDEADAESRTPVQVLAEHPVSKRFLEEIEDDSVRDEVSLFETPDSVEDVCYLKNPDRFEEEHDIDETGDHSREAAARTAVRLTSGDRVQTSDLQRWMDQLDNRDKRLVLSAAVRSGAPRTLPVDPEPWDSFRSTNYWPVVKRDLSQPVLSYIKRHDDEYVHTSEIAEGTGFPEDVVRRLLFVLYENETVEPDDDKNWKYNEEVRFRDEKIPDNR